MLAGQKETESEGVGEREGACGDRPAEKLVWQAPGVIVAFLLVALGLLTVDLWVKDWAFETVAGKPVLLTRENAQDPEFWRQYPHDTTVVVPRVLGLRLVTNKGAVFGLGQGKQYVFAGVTVLAVGVIGWIFLRSPAKAWLTHMGLAFILAGAVGNFYDRVVYGVVRDMFLLFPGTNIFPWVFNPADVFLDVGVVVAVYIILFGQGGEGKKAEVKS